MNQSREKLINQLAKEAGTQKVSPVQPAHLIGTLFAFAVLAISAILMYLEQPFRASLISQLQTLSLFTLETTSGLLAIMMLAVLTYRSATPGERLTPLLFAVPLYLIWLAVILSGFVEPVLPVSMEGKREQCYFEAVFYSSAIAVLFSLLLRRRMPFRPRLSAFLAALVASTIPAFLMQLYCMHEAHHSLTHHLFPMFLSTLLLTPLIYVFLTFKRAQ